MTKVNLAALRGMVAVEEATDAALGAITRIDRPRETYNGLHYFRESHRFEWKGKRMGGLTAAEANALLLLARNMGEAMTYRKLYDAIKGRPNLIAGDGATGFHSNVRTCIKRIRVKFREIDPTCDPHALIATYSCVGYYWVGEKANDSGSADGQGERLDGEAAGDRVPQGG